MSNSERPNDGLRPHPLPSPASGRGGVGSLAPFIDRPLEQLDPVETAILMIGMYELRERTEIPYRVVINEAVDLCKRFGATDAHKYINAVLDRAARNIRAAERG